MKILKYSIAIFTLCVLTLNTHKVKGQGCGGIDYSYSISSGCSPVVVAFKATGFSPGSTFMWDFGNGPIAGFDTIVEVFTKPGKYTVKLTVNSALGGICNVSKTNIIEVFATPSPVFSVTPGRVICDGAKEVIFSDSTPNVSSREWIIDGISYTNAPPVIKHNFSTTGYKSVSLKVTNSAGCMGIFSDNKYVSVFDAPSLDFCADISVTKTQTSVKYTPSVSAPGRTITKYKWVFNGGNPATYTGITPPTVIYADPTKKYDVTLSVTTSDGCTYDLTRSNFIQPFISIPSDSLCMSKQPFTIVNLADNNGRGFFIFKMFEPMLEFAPGSNSPRATYTSAGTFDFKYSFKYSRFGCDINVTYPGYVTIKGPKVGFTSPDRQLCAPGTKVRLVNTTNVVGAKDVKYTWMVTDSNNKVVFTLGPTFTRDTFFIPKVKGSYGVDLRAESSNGCTDYLSQKNFIMVSTPKASFYLDTTQFCYGEWVKLKDATLPIDPGSSYKYSWQLTNIDTPNVKYTLMGKDPSLKPIPGRYDVMMVVENGNCKDTFIQKKAFAVNGIIGAVSLSRNSGCLPLLVTAVGRIIFQYPKDPFISNLKFNWSTDDGDGVVDITNPNNQSTGFLFSGSGVFTIYFNITDREKCVSQVVLERAVTAGTGAAFYLGPPGCVGDTVEVHNMSKDIDHYKWLADPPNSVIFYPNDSSESVKLIPLLDTCYIIKMTTMKVLADEICVDTIQHPLCLSLPAPTFTTNDTAMYCSPQIATFSAEAENASTYIWQFGDGTVLSTNSNKTAHVYKNNNNAGYTVKLTVLDSNGCSASVTKTHLVKITGPQPGFKTNSHAACDSAYITFYDSSTRVIDPVLFLGDGTNPTTFKDSISHLFLMAGGRETTDSIFYYPVLIAKEGNCTAYYQDTIKLFRTPEAYFGSPIPGGCVPSSVQFYDSSYNAVSWLWDLNGDGIIDDSTQNPSFYYDSVGSYDVTLLVANRLGCTHTITRKGYINIQPIPVASFIPSNDTICQKEIISFNNTSTSFSNYTMDYGDGTPKDSNGILKHQYYYDSSLAQGDSIFYVPHLRVYNDFGCMNDYYDTIVIFPRPIPGYFADIQVGCNPLTVTFTDTSKYTTHQEWDFDNDGMADTFGKVVSHTFEPGFHTIRLKVYNKNNCADSAIKVNMIYVQEAPDVDFSVSDSIVCLGDSVTFFDQSTPQSRLRSWRWQFDEANAESDTAVIQNPSFAFMTPGYHYISLSVVDDQGCTNSIVKKAIFVEDQLPPQIPPINYVSVHDSSIEIDWERSPLRDFYEYRLYRGTDPNPIFISNDKNNTHFRDEDPTKDVQNSSYCYTLEIMDKCGNISIPQDSSCSIVLKAQPVATAANLLEWSAYRGWKSVSEYRIFKAIEQEEFQYLTTVSGNTLSYIDSVLCDKNYRYFVVAMDPNRIYEARSNKDSSRPTYIYQSFGLELNKATVVNNSYINVHWQPGIQSNLNQYRIDRFTKSSGWQNNYGTSKIPFFEDFDVDINYNSYVYRIRTEDDCGYLSPYSNIGTSILLKAQVVDDKVVLKWNAYRNWFAGINQYVVQIRDRNKNFQTVATISGFDSTFIDDSVYSTIDTAYCYRILAIEDGINPDTSVSNISCTILSSRIYIPNAFSPNKDSKNDEWRVFATGVYSKTNQKDYNILIQVYNRWGEKVFETDDVEKGWDGTYKGSEAPLGVYVYRVSAQGLDGKVITLKGNISLIR